MSFAWPWLFLALPLPWVVRALLPPVCVTALRVPQLPETVSRPVSAPARLWLPAFAWLLLVTAAARPQLPGDPVPVRGDGGLVIAFDVSMSMSATDLQHGNRTIERLQAARTLADGFLARRDGGRAGLVVFGSQAYLHTPLTWDMRAVRDALASVQAGLAGRETALGDAIALSVKYLKDLPEQARVLVLLTDGASTAGALEPSRAAWLARRESVRIHAVGVGASSDLDETTLREIAAQTGGQYMRATDSRAIAAFFDGVAHSESAVRNDAPRPMREMYPWPLALACLLSALSGRRKQRGAAA